MFVIKSTVWTQQDLLHCEKGRVHEEAEEHVGQEAEGTDISCDSQPVNILIPTQLLIFDGDIIPESEHDIITEQLICSDKTP